MTVQLSSIEQAPVSVPIWHTMMDDLCDPPAARVARVLGLGLRTVQRYNATGYAPRHVCLAVFWLTRWGRSAVHVQAENDARMLASYIEGFRRQVSSLESKVAHLKTIGHFGAANDPVDIPPRLCGDGEQLARALPFGVGWGQAAASGSGLAPRPAAAEPQGYGAPAPIGRGGPAGEALEATPAGHLTGGALVTPPVFLTGETGTSDQEAGLLGSEVLVTPHSCANGGTAAAPHALLAEPSGETKR